MSKYRLPRKWTETVWFPALLSGIYEQTQGVLQECAVTYAEDDETHDYPIAGAVVGYCCLGVAAAASGVDRSLFGELSYVQTVEQTKCENSFKEENTALMVAALLKGYPKELLFESEFDILGDPTVLAIEGRTLAEALAGLNDSNEHTFATIVDWIKENVDLYDEETIVEAPETLEKQIS